MMGRQSKVQNKLFYSAINLEKRVRKNHILRKAKRKCDLCDSAVNYFHIVDRRWDESQYF